MLVGISGNHHEPSRTVMKHHESFSEYWKQGGGTPCPVGHDTMSIWRISSRAWWGPSVLTGLPSGGLECSEPPYIDKCLLLPNQLRKQPDRHNMGKVLLPKLGQGRWKRQINMKIKKEKHPCFVSTKLFQESSLKPFDLLRYVLKELAQKQLPRYILKELAQ